MVIFCFYMKQNEFLLKQSNLKQQTCFLHWCPQLILAGFFFLLFLCLEFILLGNSWEPSGKRQSQINWQPPNSVQVVVHRVSQQRMFLLVIGRWEVSGKANMLHCCIVIWQKVLYKLVTYLLNASFDFTKFTQIFTKQKKLPISATFVLDF